MSGGGGTNTTTQKSDPWAGQQPYLKDVFAEAQRQYQAPGPQYYGTTPPPMAPSAPTREQFTTTAPSTQGWGPSYFTGGMPAVKAQPGATTFNQAGFDTATAKYNTDLAAYNEQMQARANEPSKTLAPVSPQTEQAQQMAQRAATGQMQELADSGVWASNYALRSAVDPANNPFFQSAVSGAIRPAIQAFTDAGGPLSQIRNEATSAGQYGGTRQGIAEGIATSRLQQQVLDTAAGMGNVAYNEGLQAQGRAMAFLPQMQQAAFAPSTTLDAVGQQRQQQRQNAINDAIARWNYEQTLPQQKLSQYQNIIQGQYGGTATTDAPTPRGNPIMGGLGGAAAGASIGSAVPGIGTAVGAGIGALLGLFGSGVF